jgi:hypothetical protein
MKARRKEISPVDLYKETPGNNCGECGFPSCLAYATNIIVDQGELSACPYLSERAHREFGPKIAEQQERGVYVRREKADIADEIARDLAALELRQVASRIGGEYILHEGEEAIELPFLGELHKVTRSGKVHRASNEATPYERILLYNHMLRGGEASPTGHWVSVEKLPGAVPKRLELEEACESRLASACERYGSETLERACALAGGRPFEDPGRAHLAFRFTGFPKVPLLVLIWEGDRDFPPKAKLLMDETVTEYLDTDSLIVLASSLTDKILGKAEHVAMSEP